MRNTWFDIMLLFQLIRLGLFDKLSKNVCIQVIDWTEWDFVIKPINNGFFLIIILSYVFLMFFCFFFSVTKLLWLIKAMREKNMFCSLNIIFVPTTYHFVSTRKIFCSHNILLCSLNKISCSHNLSFCSHKKDILFLQRIILFPQYNTLFSHYNILFPQLIILFPQERYFVLTAYYLVPSIYYFGVRRPFVRPYIVNYSFKDLLWNHGTNFPIIRTKLCNHSPWVVPLNNCVQQVRITHDVIQRGT